MNKTFNLPVHSRRHFLTRASQGLGAVAVASLLKQDSLQAAPQRGILQKLPLPPKAKRVIWLTMAGGPSHLETFDPKPKLAELLSSILKCPFRSSRAIGEAAIDLIN